MTPYYVEVRKGGEWLREEPGYELRDAADARANRIWQTPAVEEVRVVEPQHQGERPHGVSCPGCYAERVCNQCGERTTMMTGRCTNGRCRGCCPKVCKHVVSA